MISAQRSKIFVVARASMPRGRASRVPRLCLGAAVVTIVLLVESAPARAGLVYTINTTTNPTTPINTANPTSDGAVSATATFSTFTGLVIGSQTYSGVEIVLNNLLNYNGKGGEGLAISGVKFQFGNTTLGTALKSGSPTLVQNSGTEITTATNTVLSTVTGSSGNLYHWGAGTDSSNYFHVETVGNFASGGKPNHLVVPTLTSGSSYNSSFAQHDNGFDAQAEFWVAFNPGVVTGSTALTSNDITNVEIQFGTSGNAFGATELTVTPQVTAAPGPASAILLSLGAGMCGLLRRFRRPFPA
jgi:hypothetical protein